MIRPVINQIGDQNAVINNFDASTGASVRFYYGGSQSYGSTLYVYSFSNLSKPIYENTVWNMSCTNAIAGKNLENGKKYVAEIVSYDSPNPATANASEVSDQVQFWCYSTPVFKFSNISDGDLIDTQSFIAKLFYEQDDGIELSKFKFRLYKDSQAQLVEETEYFTNYDKYKNYQFKGLENNHFYYIQAVGQTTRAQQLDTGLIEIFIQFESPEVYSVLYANADNSNGIIEYNTNIRLIEPNRPKEDYYFDNGFIYLGDDTITYDTNFVLEGDFIMAIRHKDALGQILKCSNTNRGFNLSIIKCDEDQLRYKLSVPNEVCNYILYSEPFEMDFNKIYTCWIKRVNNLYEIRHFIETDMSDEYNLFLGTNRPSSDCVKYDLWINTDVTPTVRIQKDDVVVWKQLAEPTENLEYGNIWIDIDLEE